jgi:hypothetical protein
LRSFLGLELGQSTPDHSTISRTRRLIDVETHRKVFLWVLGMLAEEGLLKGNTVSVDGTTLEANAALRSIVRRDSGQGYDDFLKGLAKESGIETPRPSWGQLCPEVARKSTSGATLSLDLLHSRPLTSAKPRSAATEGRRCADSTVRIARGTACVCSL